MRNRTPAPGIESTNRSEQVHKSKAADQTQRKMISRAFWGTIFLLVFITIVLAVMGGLQSPTKLEPNEPSQKSTQAPKAPTEIPQTILGRIFKQASGSALKITKPKIDTYLDKVYTPVYAAIPDYASFHYSVLGEYTELGQAAMGKMTTALTNRLYSGFTERYRKAATDIDNEYLATFNKIVHDEIQQATPIDALKTPLGPITQAAIKETKTRVAVTIPLATLAAAAVSTGALKIVTAAIAKKIAVKVAAKAATKGIAKGGGILAGAGGGALLCSWSGPGAALCGAVGGVAAWLLTDAAVVNLDKYFNRDAFEAELRKMVDDDRAAKKRLLEDLITQKNRDIEKYTAERFTLSTLGSSN